MTLHSFTTRSFHTLATMLSFLSLIGVPASLRAAPAPIEGTKLQWVPYLDAGEWTLSGNEIRSASQGDSARLCNLSPTAEVMIEAEVQVVQELRSNFGFIFAAQTDRSCLMLRYFDRCKGLQWVTFDRGRAAQTPCGPSTEVVVGVPYRLKAAVIDGMALAKLWPASGDEPPWQSRQPAEGLKPGAIGLTTQDGGVIQFSKVRIWTGEGLTPLREALGREREEYEAELRKSLAVEVEPTEFVLRHADGPQRRLMVRPTVRNTLARVGGKLTLSWRGANPGGSREFSLDVEKIGKSGYEVLIPEQNAPVTLHASLETQYGTAKAEPLLLMPNRQWTFHMTHHVHYDPGFTDLQPAIIEKCTDDMDDVVRFCDMTADWPEESQFRWTVEVAALATRYIERRTPEQVEKFMNLVRQGRIEICGFNFNMATEYVGHEQLIRCLYDAQRLRRQYNITIDTAIIDDVPGYTWALPEVLQEAGITAIALRANSIRGQFLWDRSGAVPRPFYWQSPDGSRIFTWYTDSYREGNFFREPGLHEDAFAGIIRRNQQAGAITNHIQLRMGGDNLPPDLDMSKNARAWNEKYIWPRVRVSTNRQFLKVLEETTGKRCKTFRGDIPSWWAEGPGSAARETGIVRRVHDQLVDIEALWTLARLNGMAAQYPRERINAAYDRVNAFDEHTWGSSGSIDRPYSQQTLDQWRYKASHAYAAQEQAARLETEALAVLSAPLRGPGRHNLAVWNTLSWPRTDVVEVSLVATALDGARAVEVIDTRTGKAVPSQVSHDRMSLLFLATDIPPMGSVVFALDRATRAEKYAAPAMTLENDMYRLTATAEAGGVTSWWDKTLNRELLDTKAEYALGQAIHETPIGGRAAIDRKRPVEFKRTKAQKAELRSSAAGPLFQEMTLATGLPDCPRIFQTYRLYHHLKMVEVIHTIDKLEQTAPEAVYFAFPFAVPEPDVRLHTALAVMRAGKDQLTYSCQDFYAIQQFADVNGGGFGTLFAPLDAALVTVSDLNAYKWADELPFNRGHLYSMAMNNYWTTNFKAAQNGWHTFRYRLSSYSGEYDPVRSVRFSWQPFRPLRPVWVEQGSSPAPTRPAVELVGDEAVMTVLKMAEDGDDVIVRLWEPRGKPAECRLKFNLPGGAAIQKASLASAVEEAGEPLAVRDGEVAVALKPFEFVTVRLAPAKPRMTAQGH